MVFKMEYMEQRENLILKKNAEYLYYYKLPNYEVTVWINHRERFHSDNSWRSPSRITNSALIHLPHYQDAPDKAFSNGFLRKQTNHQEFISYPHPL